MERIVLVRHGATEWSVSGRYTGRTDLPLLPEGEMAARGLAGDVAAYGPFGTVLVSPLQRAMRTAKLLGFAEGALVTDSLMEWDYGTDDGRMKSEIIVDDPTWDLWTDGPHDGEPLASLTERIDGVLSVVRQCPPGNVLIVAHGHSLRVLCARWLGLDATFARSLHLDPTTVSVLGFEHGRPAIIEWNRDGSRPARARV
jgi:broad specificity phosphatase PhoE